jgi:hypothetical protein
MSFSRTTPTALRGSVLHASMRAVGMRLGGSAAEASFDMELTLVSAVLEALPRDYRALGVVLAWLEVHQERVNVPRLLRFADALSAAPLARAWWAAIGSWLGRTDARWKTLMRLYDGPALPLDDAEATALQIRRSGEDPRFAGTALRVHEKLLRSRVADVASPAQVARHHRLYLRRVQFGPNYRADVWAALDDRPEVSPAEIARGVGCAYETARSVSRDWKLARDVASSSNRVTSGP